jgi:hypothetical protein
LGTWGTGWPQATNARSLSSIIGFTRLMREWAPKALGFADHEKKDGAFRVATADTEYRNPRNASNCPASGREISVQLPIHIAFLVTFSDADGVRWQKHSLSARWSFSMESEKAR